MTEIDVIIVQGGRAYKSQYMRVYRLEKKKAGLCRDCMEILSGFGQCATHAYMNSQSVKKHYRENSTHLSLIYKERRQRLTDDGRCISCGIPLIQGEGLRCVNCQIVSHS